MAMSGLETLFANLGPATAGAFAGEREALAQKEQTLANLMEQEKINQQRLESSRYGQETPLFLENSSLKNRGLQEGLPGITANSRLATTEADEAATMSPSKVALGLEKNKTELTGEHIKQLSQFGQTLQTIAPLLQSAPPASHHAIMQQALEQAGLSQDPHMQTMAATIGKLPAAQVGPAIQKMTDWINTNTATYVQAIATGAQTAKSHETVAAGNNATSIKVAKIGAEARKARGAGISAGMQFMKLPPDRQLLAANSALTTGVDPLTGETLDASGKAQWEAVKDQATELINAGLKAKTIAATQGVGTGMNSAGQVVLQPKEGAPQIGQPKLGTAANPIVLK